MADDQNLPQSGAPKKLKTEKQREKERERRRRRRRSKKGLKPGQDVPMFLNPKKVETTTIQPPADVNPVENRQETPEIKEELEKEVAESQGEITLPSPPEVVAPSEKVSLLESEQPLAEPVQIAEEPKPEEVKTEETQIEAPIVQEEVSTEQKSTEEPHLEHSQAVFEETPAYQEETNATEEQPEEITPVEEQHDGLPHFDAETHAELLSEEELESSKKHAAKEIMEDLHGEEKHEGLSELPQREWIVGNFLKTLAWIIGVLVLIVGAFWLGSSLHLPDLVKNLFVSKQTEQLAKGDNTKVILDNDMMRHWGFQTAETFARNLGDMRDLAYNTFFVADYFGKLKDPVFYGETGVTAALYYGFGREAQYFANKFIYYVKYLGQIRQANLVKVADVLNGKVRRDEALDKYIGDTQAIFDQGNKFRKEINVQIDDLQISLNSLTPDHDRYQVDFFASVEQIQADKANQLIQSFIEVSQKQVELRAKMAALTRLSEDYNDDLVKMKARIEGLKANREALISGVTVTEVPGSDIDLVKP